MTFTMNTAELTPTFLEMLKMLFANREIEINVSEKIDETTYLLSNQANKKNLLESINDINNHTNLTSFDVEKL